MTWSRERVTRLSFGALDVFAAVLIELGVFSGLPERWWVVDLGAVVVGGLLGAAGLGLLAARRWGDDLARIAAVVALAAGLTLLAVLGTTASYLSGIYGAVGRGGALIMLLVAAMVLPYLVLFPAAQLLWLGPRGRAPAP